MPSTFSIDAERHLVRMTLSGSLTSAELRDVGNRLATDPSFRPDMALLVDLSEASADALSSQDIRGLASTSKFNRDARRAFVADNAAMYGIARMFGTYGELNERLPQARVFRTMVEAEAWLDQRPRRAEAGG
jgi:hypothetical protein